VWAREHAAPRVSPAGFPELATVVAVRGASDAESAADARYDLLRRRLARARATRPIRRRPAAIGSPPREVTPVSARAGALFEIRISCPAEPIWNQVTDSVAAPAAFVPAKVSECQPAASPAGIVTALPTRPFVSAVPEAITWGVDRSVKFQADPGARPFAE